jgi:hypothetical protein
MANFNLDNYVPVSERIEKFYGLYPEGRITTEAISCNGEAIFKAFAYRKADDAEPAATGHAYEKQGDGYINKTSHIENCETSAIGRALANLGIEVQRGIASREEMQKVERMQKDKPKEKKPSEVDRLKKIVWMAAQELGWNLDDLNAYTQDFFGGDYPVANLNEKQLSTISIELSKKIGEGTKEAA